MKHLKILMNLMKYQGFNDLKLMILKILKSTLKNLMKVYFKGLTWNMKKFTINFAAQYYML